MDKGKDGKNRGRMEEGRKEERKMGRKGKGRGKNIEGRR